MLEGWLQVDVPLSLWSGMPVVILSPFGSASSPDASSISNARLGIPGGLARLRHFLAQKVDFIFLSGEGIEGTDRRLPPVTVPSSYPSELLRSSLDTEVC